MNGRLYDPAIRRFLSPDNFVQDPFNTQNFDRYTYVYNNPLMFTDPSGEYGFFATVGIAAAVSIIGNGINNVINGVPFWYGMGKSATMGAVTAAVTFGIGAVSSSVYSTAGNTVVQETVKNGFSEILKSFAGQVVGNIMPSIDIPIGDWNISLSATILMGKGMGVGATVGLSYNTGNFSFSYGFGVTRFTKHYATGGKGTEIRNSFMASFDDGKTGFSLGTNMWSGMKGIEGESLNQRTGIAKIRLGDFRFSYENDGTPFQKVRTGDGGDSHRTAAASIGIGEFSIGFNLFTGYRPQSSYAERGGEDLQEMQRAQSLGKSSRGNYNTSMPNGFVQEDKPQYRMGALYFRYKNHRIGIDSDRYVRHPIQDIFAHHLIWFARQPGFQTLSNSILPYGQYQTSNPFTLW